MSWLPLSSSWFVKKGTLKTSFLFKNRGNKEDGICSLLQSSTQKKCAASVPSLGICVTTDGRGKSP